jgi:two-component system sensor histidine kinase KdpD
VAREEGPARRPADDHTDASWLERMKAPWQSYAKGAVICGLAALIAAPLHSYFELANIAMLFLLAVVLVSVRYGLGPSVLAAFLNVAAFDFLYVPPRFSFAVSDVQYLMTFAVMLAVGLITAKLTTGLKYQAGVASRREQRVRALYEMSRDLSGALLPEQIAEICQRFAEAVFGASTAIVLADDSDHLQAPVEAPGPTPAIDLGICQWAFDHGTEAGCGTDTLAGSPILYVPLRAPMRIRGVLALEPRNARRLMAPEQRRLLDTFARLIAISLERVHYVNVAQLTTVQMESERLRNSLLSAISHDLRTPLSALVGLADSMFLTQPPPSGAQAELAASMREEALRMNALVNNLLDMARLQAGAVKLNRQWQPLEEVVGSAIQSLGTMLAPGRVSVHLPDDLPLLEFDAVLIERVLGSPIEIGARPVDGASIEVWVADQGPGLPAGREDEIFKKFERGRRESATPGVGLGLAICRAIVEAHGGVIRAENRGSGGARFTFTLQRGAPPAMDACEEDPMASEVHS